MTLICTASGAGLIWVAEKPGGTAGTGTAGTGTAAGPACLDTSVHFTHNLIDPADVSGVAPIGGQTGTGGIIAVRSYIYPLRSLVGQQLPLYAPVDMTLVGASHYQPPGALPGWLPEYSLYFDVGCGITLNLFHVKGISAPLAAVVPPAVTQSSASTQITPPLKVATGEQVGYYLPSNDGDGVSFDFWVNDAAVTNSFISPARYVGTNYVHAVCPYQFYVEPLRSVWYAKLGTQGGVAVPGTACGTVRQGNLGTAQGQWFRDPNPATGHADVLTNDGTYLSQGVITIESDGTVRIGGFWSPEYVIIGPTDPSWADPNTVTSGHCWFGTSVNQSVTVQLDSPTAMRVAVVNGPCPASVPASVWKTYYR